MLSRWWFQPLWNIFFSNWIISPGIGVKITNVWNHHLVIWSFTLPPSLTWSLWHHLRYHKVPIELESGFFWWSNGPVCAVNLEENHVYTGRFWLVGKQECDWVPKGDKTRKGHSNEIRQSESCVLCFSMDFAKVWLFFCPDGFLCFLPRFGVETTS